MQNITRTVHGSRLQTAQHSGLPWAAEANTTLNERFGILSGLQPASGVYPQARYYCIGNGGHAMAVSGGGVPYAKPKPRKVTMAGLYSPLPFVLRATNDDISNDEQQKYALRKQITVESTNYIAYYLKRIPTDAAVLASTIETTTDGTTTSAAFVPGPSDLTPTAPDLEDEGENVLLGQYAKVSAPLPLVLTVDECNEILNAAEIIYGDPALAIISEIGLVAAVDHQISLPNQNTMLEAKAAIITAFIAAGHFLQFAATGINATLNVGTNEPMLVLGPA